MLPVMLPLGVEGAASAVTVPVECMRGIGLVYSGPADRCRTGMAQILRFP